MKTSLSVLALMLLTTNAFAKATLRVPVMIDTSDKGTPAAEINEKLKKIGAPLIPLYLEVSSGERDVYQKVKELDADISKSLAKLGKEFKDNSRVFGGTPGEGDRKGAETCYTGNPMEVADIVASMTDSVYSDQLNIWGFKYKKTTKIVADNSDGSVTKFLNDGSKIWREWRGTGEAVLILTAQGDDGDDINEGLIYRCR